MIFSNYTKKVLKINLNVAILFFPSKSYEKKNLPLLAQESALIQLVVNLAIYESEKIVKLHEHYLKLQIYPKYSP
jgi:hypothetical protein